MSFVLSGLEVEVESVPPNVVDLSPFRVLLGVVLKLPLVRDTGVIPLRAVVNAALRLSDAVLQSAAVIASSKTACAVEMAEPKSESANTPFNAVAFLM